MLVFFKINKEPLCGEIFSTWCKISIILWTNKFVAHIRYCVHAYCNFTLTDKESEYNLQSLKYSKYAIEEKVHKFQSYDETATRKNEPL